MEDSVSTVPYRPSQRKLGLKTYQAEMKQKKHQTGLTPRSSFQGCASCLLDEDGGGQCGHRPPQIDDAGRRTLAVQTLPIMPAETAGRWTGGPNHRRLASHNLTEDSRGPLHTNRRRPHLPAG